MKDRGERPAMLRRPRDLGDAPPGAAGRRTPDTWPDGFVASAADRHALLVLLGLASVTPRRLLAESAVSPSADACLDAVRAGRLGSPADRARAARADPAGVAEQVAALGARLVAVGDPEYPTSLLDLHDPPAGLLLRGLGLGRIQAAVAIVGARSCSPTGREVAAALAAALAGAGAATVSGGARGIDAAAHRGALEAGGPTIAVLGSGIDVAYPRSNRSLLEEVAQRGTLVSEYPPGIPPEPFRFPARNRIVAALSRGVVVVEGAAGSGSVITADYALQLGREVFAVPGPVTSELAQAPLALLRDGAGLIRGPEDLLGDLGLARGSEAGGGCDGGPPGGGPIRALERQLASPDLATWRAIVAPLPAEAIARAARLSMGEAVAALVRLELLGLVRRVGGRYERRAATTPPASG